MRFLRFSYIIPRLILLVLFVLATEIGSGYLLRWALVTGGESAVGARVDIASVKSSLLDTRVLVRNIAVANPSKPMQNLFEADRIEVDFNSHALLRKKLIADYGVVSGLQLGTARQTSGSLPERSPTDASSPAANWASPIAKQYADAWLTDLDARLANDLEQQFESVRLAEALGQRWPQKYQQLESQALAIKTEAKKLEQDVRAARKNPLRHMEFLTDVPSRVAVLRQQLASLQAEMAQLPDQLASDRAAVQAAREHDEQLVRQQLELGNVDAKSLSNYLLGERITAPLGEAVGWVRWARNFVPPRGKVANEPPMRGHDVVFAGCEQLPDMLVKAVRLDGSARLGGQQVDLVGVVRDWTNQPHRHSRPTTMELTTKGGLPLTVQAKFDRSADTPRDVVYCNTNDVLLPALSLGKPGKLQMAVAPTRADVTLEMNLVGDELTGSVQITQRGITLRPTVAGGVLGTRLQEALQQRVANIDQATTAVALSGTLDDPKFAFDSTLGTAVATAIQRAATDVIAAERERLLAKSQQQVDAELAKLNGEFVAFQDKLKTELQAPGDILAGLLTTGGKTEIGQSPFGQLLKLK